MTSLRTAVAAVSIMLFPAMLCVAGNGNFPDSLQAGQPPLVLPGEPSFPDEPELDYSAILDVIINSECGDADPDSLAEMASLPLGDGAFLPGCVSLTENDYREVAKELGVETAVIKAVVDVEAGTAHKGFCDSGKPLINFDLAMFRKFAPKHKVSLKKARKSHPVIFSRPDVRRYGSSQGGQYLSLIHL